MLIFRPNIDGAVAYATTILWISSAIRALSSAKGSVLTSIYFFLFALKYATVKRSAFWCDWMYTSSSMSLNARYIRKSMGASTHPCLTPFVILNVSETSPPFLTLTIIPVCRLSIMVLNFFGASIFPQQMTQSSHPNGVECLREVDKYNIQRTIWHHLWGEVT